MSSLAIPQAAASVAERQREIFKEAYERARQGDADVLRETQSALSDYVLWPDLISAVYLGRLSQSDGRAIEAHLDRFPDTSLNRTLRYRYGAHLAKLGATQRYLALYDTHFADAGDTDLDCYAAHARLHNANTADHRRQALDLWLVGKSQPKACDPLFFRLDKDGLLTSRRYAERLHLALARGELKFASYLARKAPEAERVWRLALSSCEEHEDPVKALDVGGWFLACKLTAAAQQRARRR
ncbi:MAG: hypothetical protein AAFU65_10840, partial [Pseudomonadota bacterium]